MRADGALRGSVGSVSDIKQKKESLICLVLWR